MIHVAAISAYCLNLQKMECGSWGVCATNNMGTPCIHWFGISVGLGHVISEEQDTGPEGWFAWAGRKGQSKWRLGGTWKLLVHFSIRRIRRHSRKEIQRKELGEKKSIERWGDRRKETLCGNQAVNYQIINFQPVIATTRPTNIPATTSET